ncbi:MAG: hypothetical protein LIR25_07800, partial [bacterium]|nr:hypothetical protein [bacterium]
ERSYDREDRPSRRSFDEKRSFQHDDSERRPFRERRDSEDRKGFERKSFDRKPFEKKPFDRKPFDGERRSDSRRKSSSKPYGYDSFKPARSREDSNDFFWNAEDLDPKKRDDKD